jgi:hypothetical protein
MTSAQLRPRHPALQLRQVHNGPCLGQFALSNSWSASWHTADLDAGANPVQVTLNEPVLYELKLCHETTYLNKLLLLHVPDRRIVRHQIARLLKAFDLVEAFFNILSRKSG